MCVACYEYMWRESYRWLGGYNRGKQGTRDGNVVQSTAEVPWLRHQAGLQGRSCPERLAQGQSRISHKMACQEGPAQASLQPDGAQQGGRLARQRRHLLPAQAVRVHQVQRGHVHVQRFLQQHGGARRARCAQTCQPGELLNLVARVQTPARLVCKGRARGGRGKPAPGARQHKTAILNEHRAQPSPPPRAS